jgi:hypothetical protein
MSAIFVLSTFAESMDTSGMFCPLNEGSRWKYSFFSKKEKHQKDDISIYVKNSEIFGGVLCKVYEIPSKSMCFYITSDAQGVYLKGAKINIPVLGFINVNIIFKPDALVFKFPIITGDAWSYKGSAVASTMFFISSGIKVDVDFIIAGIEEVKLGDRTVYAYHLYAVASRRWNQEKPIYGDCWFSENIGLVKGETMNSRIELKSYYEGSTPAAHN